MEKLKGKQAEVYEFLKSKIKNGSESPSVIEICRAVGIKSIASVHIYLEGLERKGYIKRSTSKLRNIQILKEEEISEDNEQCEYVNIPIIGTVAAGKPIFAHENIEGYFPIAVEYLKNNDCFMLKISGDSMINAGILNNDLVLVNQQPTAENNVIALIGENATCKRFFKEKDRIRLQPENDDYSPIYSKNVKILGKVIGLFRTFR